MKEIIKTYMVYKFLFPGGEIYIGKSGLKTYVRWGAGHNYGKNTPVGKAIAKYGWENVQTFVLYDNLSLEEANRLEDIEINKHGGINYPFVLNVKGGGDRGYKLSDAEIEANRQRNIQYNKEHPEKMQKHKEYMKKYREEHPDMMAFNRIKVRQYILEGTGLKFIAEYKSIAEASKLTGTNATDISSCINGKNYTAGGFYWLAAEHRNPIVNVSNQDYGRVPVYQVDPETLQIINKFPSIKEAVIHTGASYGNISSCTHGVRAKAGGFMWITEDQLPELLYKQQELERRNSSNGETAS